MNDIVINKDGFNTFVRFEPVTDLDKYSNSIKKERIIITNLGTSIPLFFDELKAYEDTKKRNYANSTYEARFGVQLQCLLPSTSSGWADARIKSITVKYIKQLIGKEKGLKYIVSYKTINSSKYLRIYISDREVYRRKEAEVYSRDYYRNSITKKMCGKDHPNAELFIKKGQPVLDENGNPKVEKKVFKDKKTRIFCYKNEHKDDFYTWFKKLFIQVISQVKNAVVAGVYFRRNNLRFAYNAYLRRIVVATNKCKQLIQNELNLLIHETMRYPDKYEVNRYLYEAKDRIPTNESKRIKEVFDYFNKVFKDGKFEYKNEILHIKDTTCDVVENNLIKLKSYFYEMIESLNIN